MIFKHIPGQELNSRSFKDFPGGVRTLLSILQSWTPKSATGLASSIVPAISCEIRTTHSYMTFSGVRESTAPYFGLGTHEPSITFASPGTYGIQRSRHYLQSPMKRPKHKTSCSHITQRSVVSFILFSFSTITIWSEGLGLIQLKYVAYRSF